MRKMSLALVTAPKKKAKYSASIFVDEWDPDSLVSAGPKKIYCMESITCNSLSDIVQFAKKYAPNWHYVGRGCTFNSSDHQGKGVILDYTLVAGRGKSLPESQEMLKSLCASFGESRTLREKRKHLYFKGTLSLKEKREVCLPGSTAVRDAESMMRNVPEATQMMKAYDANNLQKFSRLIRDLYAVDWLPPEIRKSVEVLACSQGVSLGNSVSKKFDRSSVMESRVGRFTESLDSWIQSSGSLLTIYDEVTKTVSKFIGPSRKGIQDKWYTKLAPVFSSIPKFFKTTWAKRKEALYAVKELVQTYGRGSEKVKVLDAINYLLMNAQRRPLPVASYSESARRRPMRAIREAGMMYGSTEIPEVEKCGAGCRGNCERHRIPSSAKRVPGDIWLTRKDSGDKYVEPIEAINKLVKRFVRKVSLVVVGGTPSVSDRERLKRAMDKLNAVFQPSAKETRDTLKVKSAALKLLDIVNEISQQYRIKITANEQAAFDALVSVGYVSDHDAKTMNFSESVIEWDGTVRKLTEDEREWQHILED